MELGSGGSGRQQRRRSGREQMPAVAEASNLRDLLKVRDEDAGDEHRRRNAVAKITLAAVLGSERRNGGDGGDGGGSPMSRTLLDIIREESSASASVGDYSNNSNSTNRMGWKTFKDRLLLRRAGAAWTSSVHIPASDVPMRTISSSSSSRSRAQMISRQQSTRFPTTVPAADESLPAQTEDDALSPPLPPTENAPPSGGRGQISRLSSTRFPRVTFILDDPDRRASDEPPSTSRYRESESVAEGEAEGEEEEEEEEGGGRERDEGPVRMSLMDLLEETDRQMGVAGPVYRAEAGEQEEEEDEEEEVEDGGGEGLQGEYNCCVCMVRHKGAAFIPCGHTFCRLCSRELWVSRGNCPICNGFILEVLDIF